MSETVFKQSAVSPQESAVMRERQFLKTGSDMDELIVNKETDAKEVCCIPGRFIFTTSSGVFLYDSGRIIWLIKGFCFGICRSERNLYYATQEVHHDDKLHRYRISRLFEFELRDNRAYNLRLLRTGLHHGAHQIAYRDNSIFYTDGVRNKVVIFKATDSGLWGYAHADTIEYDSDSDIKGQHLNSIWFDNDYLYLIAHNNSVTTGRPSSLYRITLSGRLCSACYLNGRCAHDIIVNGGNLFFCDSEGGTVRSHDGIVFFSPDNTFTRGLYIGDSFNVVGGSERVHRSMREKTHAHLYITDRDFSIIGRIVIGKVEDDTMAENVKVICGSR
jgi:hypothetical protein